MNVRMWLHKATQSSKILQDFGYLFIGQKEKWHVENSVRVKCQVQDKFFLFKNYFEKEYYKAENLKALVTAGPTREYIDPIRYISNDRVENMS